MILLDTNALIWLHQGDQRAAPLIKPLRRLYVSPASALELQFLIEAGRLKLRPGKAVSDVIHTPRVLLDDPPGVAWFDQALTLTWTRDPFDRLIVAHARLRGWRMATADATIVRALLPDDCIEL